MGSVPSPATSRTPSGPPITPGVTVTPTSPSASRPVLGLMSKRTAGVGASDGSQASLNDAGQRVMQAVRDAGLVDYYVNLMVMDYG